MKSRKIILPKFNKTAFLGSSRNSVHWNYGLTRYNRKMAGGERVFLCGS